jgi:hypothetical protein
MQLPIFFWCLVSYYDLWFWNNQHKRTVAHREGARWLCFIASRSYSWGHTQTEISYAHGSDFHHLRRQGYLKCSIREQAWTGSLGSQCTNSTSAVKQYSQAVQSDMSLHHQTVSMSFRLSNEIYADMQFVMATQLLSLRNIGNDFHEWESRMNVCSVMFTDTCEGVAYFRVSHRLLGVQYDKMLIREEILNWHSVLRPPPCSVHENLGDVTEWRMWKVKGKVVSVLPLTEHHAMKAYWEWRYSSTHSLTSALDGGEWSASRSE